MGKNTNVKKLFDVLVYCLFAGVLLPIINTSFSAIEGDTDNWSASEILLAGLVTTVVLIFSMYGIIKEMQSGK